VVWWMAAYRGNTLTLSANTLDARLLAEQLSLREILGIRSVRALIFAKFMSDSAWYFYLFWLPKYLYDVRGFDVKHVSYYAWIPYAASGIGSFLGGYAEAFSQIGKGAYPDYEFGFQLNVPLANTAARADNDRAELGLQQQRIQTQQLINAVRLQATKSAFALEQARRQYLAGVKNHKLRQQTLDLERKMFDLGTAAMGQLLNAQHELDLAELQESTARNTYARALINLDSVLNETLDRNHIVIDDPPARQQRPGAQTIPQASLPHSTSGDAR